MSAPPQLDHGNRDPAGAAWQLVQKEGRKFFLSYMSSQLEDEAVITADGRSVEIETPEVDLAIPCGSWNELRLAYHLKQKGNDDEFWRG